VWGFKIPTFVCGFKGEKTSTTSDRVIFSVSAPSAAREPTQRKIEKRNPTRREFLDKSHAIFIMNLPLLIQIPD
jgi:hypothetical protein